MERVEPGQSAVSLLSHLAPEAFFVAAISILFHGLAYAMVLYLISVGLSVTMGLMGFVNLAHGVFAMLGGFAMTTLMQKCDLPFFAALIVAVITVAAVSLLCERILYRPLYGRSALDQALMTVGLMFMAMAAAKYAWGPLAMPFAPPETLRGQIDLGVRTFPVYRTFLIVCGATVATALWLGVDRTQFGAKIRAAVDDLSTAQALGINTSQLFAITFALGSGLAALGGGLGAEILPINFSYAPDYLVDFLIVVCVGGTGSVRGSFLAALLVGISDTAFKYLLPELGSFFIYALTLLLLVWRPRGLLVAS